MSCQLYLVFSESVFSVPLLRIVKVILDILYYVVDLPVVVCFERGLNAVIIYECEIRFLCPAVLFSG